MQYNLGSGEHDKLTDAGSYSWHPCADIIRILAVLLSRDSRTGRHLLHKGTAAAIADGQRLSVGLASSPLVSTGPPA